MDALGKEAGGIPCPSKIASPRMEMTPPSSAPQVGRSRSSQMLSSTVISGVSPIIRPISVAPRVCAA